MPSLRAFVTLKLFKWLVNWSRETRCLFGRNSGADTDPVKVVMVKLSNSHKIGKYGKKIGKKMEKNREIINKIGKIGILENEGHVYKRK